MRDSNASHCLRWLNRFRTQIEALFPQPIFSSSLPLLVTELAETYEMRIAPRSTDAGSHQTWPEQR